jgi:hypothetical protein
MQTPTQVDPYVQSRTFWDDPAYALNQALTSLTNDNPWVAAVRGRR